MTERKILTEVFNTAWFQTAFVELTVAVDEYSIFTAEDMRRIQENARRLLEDL